MNINDECFIMTSDREVGSTSWDDFEFSLSECVELIEKHFPDNDKIRIGYVEGIFIVKILTIEEAMRMLKVDDL